MNAASPAPSKAMSPAQPRAGARCPARSRPIISMGISSGLVSRRCRSRPVAARNVSAVASATKATVARRATGAPPDGLRKHTRAIPGGHLRSFRANAAFFLASFCRLLSCSAVNVVLRPVAAQQARLAAFRIHVSVQVAMALDPGVTVTRGWRRQRGMAFLTLVHRGGPALRSPALLVVLSRWRRGAPTLPPEQLGNAGCGPGPGIRGNARAGRAGVAMAIRGPKVPGHAGHWTWPAAAGRAMVSKWRHRRHGGGVLAGLAGTGVISRRRKPPRWLALGPVA